MMVISYGVDLSHVFTGKVKQTTNSEAQEMNLVGMNQAEDWILTYKLDKIIL